MLLNQRKTSIPAQKSRLDKLSDACRDQLSQQRFEARNNVPAYQQSLELSGRGTMLKDVKTFDGKPDRSTCKQILKEQREKRKHMQSESKLRERAAIQHKNQKLQTLDMRHQQELEQYHKNKISRSRDTRLSKTITYANADIQLVLKQKETKAVIKKAEKRQQRFTEHYTDYVENQVIAGHDPLACDTVKEFKNAPEKEEKQRIVQQQLIQRKRHLEESKRSISTKNLRTQDNLRKLEQRYYDKLSLQRKQRLQAQCKPVKQLRKTMTFGTELPNAANLFEASSSSQSQQNKRKRKGNNKEMAVEVKEDEQSLIQRLSNVRSWINERLGKDDFDSSSVPLSPATRSKTSDAGSRQAANLIVQSQTFAENKDLDEVKLFGGKKQSRQHQQQQYATDQHPANQNFQCNNTEGDLQSEINQTEIKQLEFVVEKQLFNWKVGNQQGKQQRPKSSKPRQVLLKKANQQQLELKSSLNLQNPNMFHRKLIRRYSAELLPKRRSQQQNKRKRMRKQQRYATIENSSIEVSEWKPQLQQQRVQISVPAQQQVAHVMEPPPGATVYLKSQLEPAEQSIKMTQSVPEQPLVTRLQDSFSQKVNDEKVVKASNLRGSQNFSSHLSSSMVSDQTDATDAQLAASSSSIGDFSRFAGSSFSMSRTTGLDSMAMRGINYSVRDPLSMISAHAQRRVPKTPDLCIEAAILEEDEDEPDFLREQQQQHDEGNKVSQTLSVTPNFKKKIDVEEDQLQQQQMSSIMHNSAVEASYDQLRDYQFDQPVDVSPIQLELENDQFNKSQLIKCNNPMQISDLNVEDASIQFIKEGTSGDLVCGSREQGQTSRLMNASQNSKVVSLDEEDPAKKLVGMWWKTPHDRYCNIAGCKTPALRDGKEIWRCSFVISWCGSFPSPGGCGKPFCFRHRAKDTQNAIPTICMNCKEAYIAARKNQRIIYIILAGGAALILLILFIIVVASSN